MGVVQTFIIMKFIAALVLVILLCSCASSDRKLYLDQGHGPLSDNVCGIESYVNRYAFYRCDALELEDSNNYINQQSPLHNIKRVVAKKNQRLLIIDEKVFDARVRTKDQKIVCTRRLKVILNPGVGRDPSYQMGWLTYQPQCMSFLKVKPTSRTRELSGPYLSNNKVP